MPTIITDDIKVSVETLYQPEYSNPENNHFIFSYRITIENMGKYTIQLLRRQWQIYDSIGSFREVEGEGVVGEQPIIAPGEQYQYVSGCNLKSDFGSMKGCYEMFREFDNQTIIIQIPQFNLITKYKLN